jgi:hypothetical protein
MQVTESDILGGRVTPLNEVNFCFQNWSSLTKVSEMCPSSCQTKQLISLIANLPRPKWSPPLSIERAAQNLLLVSF